MGTHGERKLDADGWRAVLTRLSQELPQRTRIYVIGGVAMALAYGARRTTRDLDAILPFDAEDEVLKAACRIAKEFNLPTDWLNQKAKQTLWNRIGGLVPEGKRKQAYGNLEVVWEDNGSSGSR